MQELIDTTRIKSLVKKMSKIVKKTQMARQSQTLKVRAKKSVSTRTMTKTRQHVSKKFRMSPKMIPTMSGMLKLLLTRPSCKLINIARYHLQTRTVILSTTKKETQNGHFRMKTEKMKPQLLEGELGLTMGQKDQFTSMPQMEKHTMAKIFNK